MYTEEIVKDEESVTGYLSVEEPRTCRALPCFRFSAKEISRSVSCPNVVKGFPIMRQLARFMPRVNFVRSVTKRSTSGGIVTLGKHPVRWSDVVGGGWFYTMTEDATRGVGMKTHVERDGLVFLVSAEVEHRGQRTLAAAKSRRPEVHGFGEVSLLEYGGSTAAFVNRCLVERK